MRILELDHSSFVFARAGHDMPHPHLALIATTIEMSLRDSKASGRHFYLTINKRKHGLFDLDRQRLFLARRHLPLGDQLSPRRLSLAALLGATGSVESDALARGDDP